MLVTFVGENLEIGRVRLSAPAMVQLAMSGLQMLAEKGVIDLDALKAAVGQLSAASSPRKGLKKRAS